MEEWKDAPGFEGFYQVSNEGHFRSVDRTVIMKTKMVKINLLILSLGF